MGLIVRHDLLRGVDAEAAKRGREYRNLRQRMATIDASLDARQVAIEMKEVRAELREVKEDVKEVKQELREVKEQQEKS